MLHVESPALNGLTVEENEKNRQKTKSRIRRDKKRRKKIREESIIESTIEHDKNTIVDKSLGLKNERLEGNENGENYVNNDSLSVFFELDENDPTFMSFKEIFDKFSVSVKESNDAEIENKGEIFYSDDNIEEEEEEEDMPKKLSRKKARRQNRLSVAELKQLVKNPEVVEWFDVSAQDPKLLAHLKAYRNTIPVPSHWMQKRDYLASKRGIEKPPFELPDFIRATGIMEMRDSVREKEDNQTLRQKMRARVQPKMGKLDIDYQKLYNAFFRFQTKPPMTEYGEVYYEGKEFETNLKERRPGDLSEELKEALNIPPGAPPPWLINMQRFGPPPSYPALKIPGLNAPIPSGAQFGFHPGGWGKPPVDEFNRPLYGDVFGIVQPQAPPDSGEPVERQLWGQLEDIEEESEQEEDEEDDDEKDISMNNQEMFDGIETPLGVETPSGMVSSVPSGIETPEYIELRKQRISEVEHDSGRSFYQPLAEQQSRIKGFMGSEHIYDLSSINKLPVLDAPEPRKKKKNGVDVSLDPSLLENENNRSLAEKQLREKYEEAQRMQRIDPKGWDEDLSEMVAEQAAKQSAKRQKKVNEQKKEKFNF
ncbi:hypothetical protein PNEG_03521 [Pneumocystis murina B123]|uniref:PSP proline-rich domain-containing protein n=1 Tax=Pneumocystis murina (strain B123) TaxID=1069680 RepID=M7NLR3_PNEMU|nr:hypothetical protein PNEG_03521 [Pneumocystis murina B123]EMR08081.1 hypothetical protein PNEG_03521 [Pneumocystis murina B123]